MQNTLQKPVSFHGLSLFHGYPVSTTVLPADVNTGIVFRRIDLDGVDDIPARCESVRPVPRRTVIGLDDTNTVETIEHLMAALAGLQIDNAMIEVDAPELPSFDGSCIHFCDAILDAGIVTQTAAARTFRVRSTRTIADSEATNTTDQNTIQVRPGLPNVYELTYHLDYGADSPLAQQSATLGITPEIFYSEIAKARTFVLDSEIRALKAMGFGEHLTPKDLVVVGQNGILDNKLHWENEAARHKILDCVGDFALSGRRLAGSFVANQSGHRMNHEVARHVQTESSSAHTGEQRQKAA